MISTLDVADDAVELVERKGFGHPDLICDALVEALSRNRCREYWPMSLGGAAGKNPMTHVGKIYNVRARDIAETLVAVIAEIAAAHCLMESRIGALRTSPAIVQAKITMRDGLPVDKVKQQVEDIAVGRPARIHRCDWHLLITARRAGANGEHRHDQT